jgi:hypothetical protein
VLPAALGLEHENEQRRITLKSEFMADQLRHPAIMRRP